MAEQREHREEVRPREEVRSREEVSNFEEQMNRIFEEMNRVWEDFWVRRGGRLAGGRMGRRMLQGERRERALGGETMEYREPMVDVFETDEEVIVTAELPGLDKDDIRLYVTGSRLEISAEKTREVTKPEKKEREGEGSYVYRERSVSRFYRSITLPATIDPEKAKSAYKNGILEVRMPKTEVTKKTPLRID